MSAGRTEGDGQRLAGRVALVTGGGSGLGAATCRALAAAGARVYVADRDERSGAAVAREIGGEFLALDVADPAAWAAVPDVDLAHLNAGIMTSSEPCTLDQLTPAVWQRVSGVNVGGVVNGVAHLAPGMARRGGGSIVVMGSLAAFVGFGADPFYAASKAAVVNLARSLAGPLAERGIRINALCPGEARTGMLPPDRAALFAAKGHQPLAPEQVAEVVLDTLLGEATGRVHTFVQGRPPQEYLFPPVPRPARVRRPEERPEEKDNVHAR